MRNAICSDHDDILAAAKHIGLLIRAIENTDDIDYIHKNAERIEDYASDIESAAISAKSSGQAMENRLSDYCNTIESLGFVRRK